MPGGTAATTYYDVVTRYRVQDAASADLNRYTRNTNRADGAVSRLRRQTRGLGRGMRTLALVAGPAMGGMVGLAAVGYGAVKTFRNLNEEINSTIQLAAQVNLAFKFEGAQDAAQNFNLAMGASRRVFRDLVRDAARLPGELQDFIGIAQQISGGVFAGGGNLQTMRALTARVALAAPAAGAGFQEAGLGAMQMLFGVARVTNPLFKMLMGQGLLPKAELFNALPAVQRLRMLDDALAKLTDNPMFRRNILRTWDTQLGTLADNLFGIEGILGQLARGPFDSLLNFLTRLNEALDRNKDVIVLLFGGTGGAGLQGEYLSRYMPSDVTFRPGLLDILSLLVPTAEQIRERQISAYIESEWQAKIKALGPRSWWMRLGPGGYADFYKEMRPLAEERWEKLFKAQEKKHEFTADDAPSTNIVQNFHIKLDLKSDDAPDAVALKIEKAMEKVGRHPTTVSRGLSAVASVAGAGP